MRSKVQQYSSLNILNFIYLHHLALKLWMFGVFIYIYIYSTARVPTR